jgi:hypothetical protein
VPVDDDAQQILDALSSALPQGLGGIGVDAARAAPHGAERRDRARPATARDDRSPRGRRGVALVVPSQNV